jgi:hypothetical protein
MTSVNVPSRLMAPLALAAKQRVRLHITHESRAVRK